MKTAIIDGKESFVVEMEDVLNAKRLPERVEIDGWPYGREKRCLMVFTVETKGKKQRFVKQSTYNGRTNKAKAATYALRVILLEIDGFMARIEFSMYGMATVYIENSNYQTVVFHDDGFETLWRKFVFMA